MMRCALLAYRYNNNYSNLASVDNSVWHASVGYAFEMTTLTVTAMGR